jgi:ribonuclease HI
MPLNMESRGIYLKFGSNQLTEVHRYKYLGFRWGTKQHDEYGGLDIAPQYEYEKQDLKRRLCWLKILASGKAGADVALLRTAYIALIRSKMSYCLLLKESYLWELEKIQSQAMKIIASALRGTPNAILSHLLDLCPIQSLLHKAAFRLYANLLDAQHPEFSDVHLWAFKTDSYNASPLGQLQFVHNVLSTRDDDIAGLPRTIQGSHCHESFRFGPTSYRLPKVPRPSKTEWSPPRWNPQEKRYYSDGSWFDQLDYGSCAAFSVYSNNLQGFSFYPCTSSTQAEKEGLLLATNLAIDDKLFDEDIVFVLDSASVLTGIRGWPFRKMSNCEFRIYANLQKLLKRGNKVRFRYVPSHLDENPQWQKFPHLLQHHDIIGNKIVDEECTRLMDHCHRYGPINVQPIDTNYIRLLGAEFSKKERVEYRTPLPGVFQQFFHEETKPVYRKLLRKAPRRQAITILRLLSNHYALPGYFFRLRQKTDAAVVPTEDELCPFCMQVPGTALHIMMLCQDPTVRNARIEVDSDQLTFSDCRDEGTQWKLYSSQLLNPKAWPSIHKFFCLLNLSP